ncbi:hypothetical protein PIB30_109458, partial [Stylosanthes scabra]|nr:hypothetical protein [Stylosanthes scabra]
MLAISSSFSSIDCADVGGKIDLCLPNLAEFLLHFIMSVLHDLDFSVLSLYYLLLLSNDCFHLVILVAHSSVAAALHSEPHNPSSTGSLTPVPYLVEVGLFNSHILTLEYGVDEDGSCH